MGLESWFVCSYNVCGPKIPGLLQYLKKKQTEFTVNTKIAFAATEPTHLQF